MRLLYTRHLTLIQIYDITKIDKWFLCKLRNLAQHGDMSWTKGSLDEELYLRGQRSWAILDKTIERISGASCAPYHRKAAYKMVDTCAAEFAGPDPLLLLHL